VDILVANAGAQKVAGIADMTLDDWRQVIELDLTGQFLCCREAVRPFRVQDSAGRPSELPAPSFR
jgi:glucose 1-dehydrogenase